MEVEGSEWRGTEKRRLRWVVKVCVCVLFAAERAASLLESLGTVHQEIRSVCAVFVAPVPCDTQTIPCPRAHTELGIFSPVDPFLCGAYCVIPDCSCLDSLRSASPSPQLAQPPVF